MNSSVSIRGPLGAHEAIGLHESLMAKSGLVELLASLSRRVQDPQLSAALERQAEAIHRQYLQGVALMQGALSPSPAGKYGSDGTGGPQLGVRNPNFPAPDPGAVDMTDRAVCASVLGQLKFQATSALHFALECAHTDLRSYLIEGVLAADRMAYEMFSYMNQKGYYPVAQLQESDLQSLTAAYQAGVQSTAETPWRPVM